MCQGKRGHVIAGVIALPLFLSSTSNVFSLSAAAQLRRLPCTFPSLTWATVVNRCRWIRSGEVRESDTNRQNSRQQRSGWEQ